MYPEAEQQIYQIALTFLPDVGPVLAKNLVAYCGSAEAVFREKTGRLEKIPGIGPGTAAKIKEAQPLQRAEEEWLFAEKNNIEILFYLDSRYPWRLQHCHDAPVVLYKKGRGDLNAQRAVAIVGTRRATAYGKEFVQQFIEELKPYRPTVVSGLAYGIDFAAHKACVDAGLPTFGVFAHGLDRIYPQIHSKVAGQMLEQGGWISEYPSGTNPDRENFPTRNRIIAGLTDATIVVEAAEKGGALITAEIASSYNRDVFAIPGRISDPYSEGCNKLIYLNKAAILRHAKDLEFYLGWQDEQTARAAAGTTQKTLFVELDPEEEVLATFLREEMKMHVDLLSMKAEMPISKVITLLFQLEMKGAVRSHPGKMFEWMAL